MVIIDLQSLERLKQSLNLIISFTNKKTNDKNIQHFFRINNYLVAEPELDPFFQTFNLAKSLIRNFISLIESLQD